MAHTNFNIAVEETDQVDSYIQKTQLFIEENRVAVIGGIVAVLLVIGGFIGYGFYKDSQEQKAQIILSQAQMYFSAAEYEVALKGDAKSFTKGFEQIVAEFGGTPAANLATYYAGICEFNLGNYDAALGYMKKYDVPSGILGVNAIALEASIYSQLGQFDNAAKSYTKAANWHKTSTTTPLYLIEAAKAYISAGNKTEASKTIDVVLNEYPTGGHIAEAERVKGMAS